MRKRKMIWKSFAALALGSVVLTSCLSDPEPEALDAVPDVFAQKIEEEGEVKYGLSLWVMGNKDLESATVEGPGDGTWTLEEGESSNRVFSLSPETADYTTTAPETGTYTFTVTSTQTDEESFTATDELEEEELEIAVIDTTEFENDKLKITWQTVEGADTYLIRLSTVSDELIYMGPQTDDDETEFSIGLSDEGWIDQDNKAVDGEPYQLELLAILYESGATSNNKDYNVQFISIASTEVLWGE